MAEVSSQGQRGCAVVEGEQTRQLGQPQYETFQMPARLANPRRSPAYTVATSLVSVIDPSLFVLRAPDQPAGRHYLKGLKSLEPHPSPLSLSEIESQARPANAVKDIRWLLLNAPLAIG